MVDGSQKLVAAERGVWNRLILENHTEIWPENVISSFILLCITHGFLSAP